VIAFTHAPQFMGLHRLLTVGSASLYSCERDPVDFALVGEGHDQIALVVDGYALGRLGASGATTAHGLDLAQSLFRERGTKAVEAMKGAFVLCVMRATSVEVFADHLGLRKLFYSVGPGGSIVTNRIDYCIGSQTPRLDRVAIASHAMLHHFAGGSTPYEGVRYLAGGGHLSVRPSAIPEVESWWRPSELLEKRTERENLSAHDILNDIFSQYLAAFQPKRVRMSLTGGMDSRLLLSSLLALDARPETYTYGDATSADVELAGRISNALMLDHEILKPDFGNAAEGFDAWAKRMLTVTNHVGHIHRTHRYWALEQDARRRGPADMIVCGFMGGEGIRGISWNDYYANPYIVEYVKSGLGLESCVRSALERNYLRGGETDLAGAVDAIANMPWISAKSRRVREFEFAYGVLAPMHHGTDISFMLEQAFVVCCPFLDVDWLAWLMDAGPNLMDNKTGIRTQHSVPSFYARNTMLGHDVLGRLPYKGGVMPSTYSGGILRFGVAKARRLWSRRTRGPTKATQPFVFGDWYRQLLLDEMREGGACVAGLFEVDQAVERLASVPFRGAEGWLHRYSDIMMFGWLCRGIR